MKDNDFPNIEPLEARRKDGSLYFRQPKVERRLASLSKSSTEDNFAALSLADEDDPDYVPTECLVAALRSLRSQIDTKVFRIFYLELFRRITSRLSREDERVKEAVLDRFTKLLAEDLKQRSTKLDYFECRFARGLKLVIFKKIRALKKKLKESKSLHITYESAEFSKEVEKASGGFDPFDPAKINEENYRIRLWKGIDHLPPPQKQVVILLMNNIQIESHDKKMKTISSILGKTPKTIRKYRDDATAYLRSFITKGEIK